MPEAAPLALLRADIDRKSHKIKRVLTDARIRKVLFNGIASDEKAAIKAFVAQNGENALKTKPKVRAQLRLRAIYRDQSVCGLVLYP